MPRKTFNAVSRNLGKQLLSSVGLFNAELFAVQLIQKDADLSLTDGRGNTALMIAAASKKTLAVEAMLAQAAPVAAVNQDGHNALSLAILDGNRKIAQLLSDKGAFLSASQIVEIAATPALSSTSLTLLREIAKKQDAAQKIPAPALKK